jgi:hypothetical protein
MSEWSVPRLWPGSTIVCLAGGPSLSLKQLRHVARKKLNGDCRTIAINDTGYLAWWADVMYASDERWWREHQAMLQHPGLKVSLMYGGVNLLRHRQVEGIEDDPGFLATGRNGGYQAINLALHLGATRIVLLGYDMKEGPGGTHWFGDHEKFPTQAGIFQSFLKAFNSLPEALKKRDVEVINCTPGSALSVFPRAELTQVI